MKDKRTHLAHKSEHVVDLDTQAIVAVNLGDANEGDTSSMPWSEVTPIWWTSRYLDERRMSTCRSPMPRTRLSSAVRWWSS